MAQKVFHRYEKKYFLSEEKYNELRKRLAPYMEEDDYGLHTIRNIYYDTKNDELIRTSLEKPKYKEKFRVRCYGQPTEQSEIFLEIKKKYNGLVNKRRVVLAKDEADAYLFEGQKPQQDSQILREIEYVLAHYNLEPKLYLAYDRVALFGKEDSEFRVTFDQNIRSRNHNLDIASDEETTMALASGSYLMEVKIANAIPLWFVNILMELEIRDTSFSKYGTVYKQNVTDGCYDYLNCNYQNNNYYEDDRRVCIC